MELPDLVNTIENFEKWRDADRIRFFAWYLHEHRKVDAFGQSDLRRCYDELSIPPPGSIGTYIANMSGRKPPELLQSRDGLRLSKFVRDDMQSRFGQRRAAIQVHKLLGDLPGKLADPMKRAFLDETIVCYRNAAFRSAIVMAWNLAYSQLCDHILRNELINFNVALPKRFPKADISEVQKRDDFTELKESQVVDVCRTAGIVPNAVAKILKDKLDRRNAAAHPSGIVVTPAQAEEVIVDLVENVVLKYPT